MVAAVWASGGRRVAQVCSGYGYRDFGEVKFASHPLNTEYMAKITLPLTGAPKANYVLLVTLRDQFNNDESASARLPFEIR